MVSHGNLYVGKIIITDLKLVGGGHQNLSLDSMEFNILAFCVPYALVNVDAIAKSSDGGL